MKTQVLRIVAVGLFVAFGGWGMASPEPPPPQIWIQDTLEGHTSWVTNMAFSPDSKILAASDNVTVYLWDVATGKRIRLLGKVGAALVFSPDSKILASRGYRNITLWDVASGKKNAKLEGDIPIISMIFSPDGKKISALGEEQIVKWPPKMQKWITVWDLEKKKEVRSWKMPAETVSVAAYSTIKRPVVAVVHESDRFRYRPISLIDAFTGETVLGFAGHKSIFGPHLTLNRDETMVVSIGSDERGPGVRMWNRVTGEHIDTLECSNAGAISFALSPDAQVLAMGGPDSFQIHEVPSGRLLAKQDLCGLSLLAFSPDGRVLASGAGRVVKLWTVPAAWRKKGK